MDVVILAAGQGTRFNSSEPKCLSAIDNQSVISRLISQISEHIPNAHIKIVLGYNPDPIIHHTSGFDVSYLVNKKFKADRNIWSAYVGIEDSEEGVLIFEGDCVYDEQTFKDIAKSLEKDSAVFLGGPADQSKTNGVVHVRECFFEEFFIGKKENPLPDNCFDMVGAFWIAPSDVQKFKKRIFELSKKGLDQYYFMPLFEKSDFRLRCHNVTGKRYTFNNKPEYLHMLKNVIGIEHFDVSKLKHIENFSPKRVDWLREKIVKEGVWTRPICIDPDGLVMDGQHRMEVSKRLGLKYVPVIIFDYEDVEIYSLRKTHEVTVDLIKSKVKNDDIYPYKTVKHIFPTEINNCNIKLDSLYEG